MSEKTILVIDDDIDLVEIIRVTLENEGYEVIDAQNGDRGKAMARQDNPDLILLDEQGRLVSRSSMAFGPWSTTTKP